MSLSVFELFRIGIGPSSSHTVGPMRAARQFVTWLQAQEALDRCAGVRAELYGSLGATGKGHGSDKAVLLGLEGECPESVDVDQIDERLQSIRAMQRLRLLGVRDIDFHEQRDLIFHRRRTLPGHSNGMCFLAFDHAGNELGSKIYYSVGGGFVADEAMLESDRLAPLSRQLPHPFASGKELLDQCRASGLSISTLMLENEKCRQGEGEIIEGLLAVWGVMSACIDRGAPGRVSCPGG